MGKEEEKKEEAPPPVEEAAPPAEEEEEEGCQVNDQLSRTQDSPAQNIIPQYLLEFRFQDRGRQTCHRCSSLLHGGKVRVRTVDQQSSLHSFLRSSSERS